MKKCTEKVMIQAFRYLSVHILENILINRAHITLKLRMRQKLMHNIYNFLTYQSKQA